MLSNTQPTQPIDPPKGGAPRVDSSTASPALTAEQAAAANAVRSLPTHVVCIGASAGGLNPIEQFFAAMPADSGAAFVIIQHLSPDFDNLMDQLLVRLTNMPIHVVEMGMTLEANHVYLNSAQQTLSISHDKFIVADQPLPTRLHYPIDRFLHSIASEWGKRAIALILSGTGKDGAQGAVSIQLNGGIVLIQDPLSAMHKSMPEAAIKATDPDGVRTPEQLAALVSQYISDSQPDVARALSMTANEAATRMDAITRSEGVAEANMVDELTPQDQIAVNRILDSLEQRFHIDFSAYKPVMIQRRIERRQKLVHAATVQAYADLLEQNIAEVDDLYRDMLVDVTHFFRDGPAFAILAKDVVPEIVQRTPDDGVIRLWVAGCASGEEAYSTGILFLEEIEQQGKACSVRIFATDGHQDSILRASAGIYSSASCESISAERLSRFFVPVKEGYQVSKPLRELMVFAHQDLLNSSPFNHLDMVTCRNVLIYFDIDAQQQLLSNFHFALKTDGVLLLGASENLGKLEEEFGVIDRKWRIFRKLRDVVLPTTHITMPATMYSSAAQNQRMHDFSQPLLNDHSNAVAGPTTTSILAVEEEGTLRPEQHRQGSLTRSYPLQDSSGRMTSDSHLSQGRQRGNWMESLLITLIPAGLILDHKNDILYIFGDAQHYLHLRLGHGTLNIFDLLEGELATAIRLAISQIFAGEEKVLVENVYTKGHGGEDELLNVIAVHLEDDEAQFRRIFVGFERSEDKPVLPKVIDMAHIPTERVSQLQYELDVTRETLQSAIEEQETTNEELSAANEELQASNEELSATNEELFTVNSEYQRTIDQLTKLTADMENLQASTQIGVLFLYPDLTIRHFTQPAANLLGLVEADIGRAVDHLTFFNLCVDMTALRDAVAQVLTGQEFKELETSPWNGDSYGLRVLPYKDDVGTIQGVVLTIIDISILKEREHLLLDREQYFNVLTGIVFELDGAGNLNRINQHGLDLLGYAENELTGRNWFDVAWPKEAKEAREARAKRHRQVIAGELPILPLDEVELITKSGKSITILRQSVLRKDVAGDIIGTITSGYDITERKQIELALAQSEQRYRTVVENQAERICRYRVDDFTLSLANPAFCQYHSKTEEELLGTSLLEMLDPNHATIVRERVQIIAQGGEPLPLEEQTFPLNETNRSWVRRVATPIKDETGRVVEIQSIVLDITERKEAELRLQEVSEQLNNIIDSIPARITYVDADLRVQFANEQITAFAIDDVQNIVGMPLEEVIGPQIYMDYMDYIQLALEGTTVNFNMEREAEGGKTIYEQVTLVPAIADGHVRGYYSFVADVSELKESAAKIELLNQQLQELNTSLEERIHQRTQELAEANLELASSNEELDRFVNMVAHDLKEPVRGLQAYAEILAESMGDKVTNEDMSEIAQVLEKMSKLTSHTNQLLDELRNYARIGRANTETDSINLEIIVDDVVEILKPLMIEAHVEIVRPMSLPTVQYNSAHLMTIFQNLITNAIKYNANDVKQVEIGTINEGLEGEQPAVNQDPSIFYVRDNGIGIQDRHYERIFEMFKRLHPEERYGGGMGVGLALIKRIIEQNGGQIWVESELNQGTVFYFTL